MEVGWLLRLAQIRLRQLRGLTPRSDGVVPPQRSTGKAKLFRSSVGFGLFILITVALGAYILSSKVSAGREKKAYDLSHPKPYTTQNGWQIYRASDVARLSQQVEGRINRVIFVGGNVRVVGNLDNARIWAIYANLVIEGDKQASEIKLGGGRFAAGSVTEGTGIIVKEGGDCDG